MILRVFRFVALLLAFATLPFWVPIAFFLLPLWIVLYALWEMSE